MEPSTKPSVLLWKQRSQEPFQKAPTSLQCSTQQRCCPFLPPLVLHLVAKLLEFALAVVFALSRLSQPPVTPGNQELTDTNQTPEPRGSCCFMACADGGGSAPLLCTHFASLPSLSVEKGIHLPNSCTWLPEETHYGLVKPPSI